MHFDSTGFDLEDVDMYGEEDVAETDTKKPIEGGDRPIDKPDKQKEADEAAKKAQKDADKEANIRLLRM